MVRGSAGGMMYFTNCEINNIIDNTPYISNIKKEFYKKILRLRYEKILKASYNKLIK